jgi:hypothetical protein
VDATIPIRLSASDACTSDENVHGLPSTVTMWCLPPPRISYGDLHYTACLVNRCVGVQVNITLTTIDNHVNSFIVRLSETLRL